jgi:dUTPase
VKIIQIKYVFDISEIQEENMGKVYRWRSNVRIVQYQQVKEVPERTLLVCRENDQQFVPSFAKEGDVGLDLPVKIKIDDKLLGRKHDRLREVTIYYCTCDGMKQNVDMSKYIYPNGATKKECPGIEYENLPFVEIPPKSWCELPAALSFKLPDDAWGFIKGRSSSSWKKHLEVVPSTIDPGYVGLLGTLVRNPNDFNVRVFEYDPDKGIGDRLAQLILVPIYPLRTIGITDVLPETKRGITGFGSSNKLNGN